MNTADERDPWLEVLAGRADPRDADTRQAAEVRQLLLQRIESAHTGAPDERMLARIRAFNAEVARTAQAASEPTAEPPRRGWLARVAGWLGAGGQGLGLGQMAAAAVVAAAAVGIFVSMPRDNDHEQIKSPPPASAPGDVTLPATPVVVTHPQPLAEATRIGRRLGEAGIAVEITPLGDSARLDATVPPARLQAVQKILAEERIAWPGGEQLALLWQQTR